MYHNFVNTIFYLKKKQICCLRKFIQKLWLKNILLKFLQLQLKSLKKKAKYLERNKKEIIKEATKNVLKIAAYLEH